MAEGGSPFFPANEADEVEAYKPPFLQRNRKKLLAALLLLLAIGIAVAVAVPLANRSKTDEADSTSLSESEEAAAKREEAMEAGVVDADKDADEDDKATTKKADTTDATVAAATTDAATAPPPAVATGGGNCVYQPSGPTISMDARVPGWGPGDESVWKTEVDGVTFKPYEGDPHRVWDAGSYQPRVYKFTVAEAGQYFVSAKTTAQARTEFNDMWLSFPYGGGLQYRNVQTHAVWGSSSGSKFVKAYQNDGYDKVGIYTIDHVPHHFNTEMTLTPGNEYQLLVAGRASKFTVKRLLLTKCVGDDCGGTAAIQGTLDAAANGPPTPCVDQ